MDHITSNEQITYTVSPDTAVEQPDSWALLSKEDPQTAQAYVNGLALAAARRPYAFSPIGEFGILERADAHDRYTANDTVTLGIRNGHGDVTAAALLSIGERYIDLEDLYNNGPRGDGAVVLGEALRYAASVREHVLVGVLPGNAGIIDIYQRIGFEPCLRTPEIMYLHLSGTDRIRHAARLLKRHGWNAGGDAASALPRARTIPHLQWLLNGRNGF